MARTSSSSVMKVALLIGALLLAPIVFARPVVDAKLAAEIAAIRAIDNHSHADPADPDRGKDWRDDAPLGTSRYPDVVPLRHDNDRVRLRFTGAGGSIAQYMRDVGVATAPATLERYEMEVVDPSLRRWKQQGAVAVKFLVAYARSIDFALIPYDVAASLYAKAATKATALTPEEFRPLEDYLFGAIAARAGAAGLVVHIHTGNGDGPYFNNFNANPALLETALGSKPLRDTRFVLLHGGWPFHQVTQAMLDKPNTYADFSAQTFYLTPRALAGVLRDWLEWHPEKVSLRFRRL